MEINLIILEIFIETQMSTSQVEIRKTLAYGPTTASLMIVTDFFVWFHC